MTKHTKPPMTAADFKAVQRGPKPVDPWMNGHPDNPAAELAARLYLRDQCCEIKYQDFQAIRKHTRELWRRGMPLEWITDSLIRVCDYWPTSADFGIRRHVRDAFNKAEMFGDLEQKDDDNRFAGKGLDYFEALPPVEWLLEDILAKKSLFVLYGREKAGKTFFALALALSVASVRPFCGLKTEWGRVLYVIGEGNESEFASRLRVWIEANSKPGKERDILRQYVQNNFKVVTVPVMINTQDQCRALLAQNPGDWDLVVIDTYMRNTSGNVNDPKDSADFVRGCDMIREEAKSAVLVCHHQGKDESRGAFGSMHLTGACDGAAMVIKQGDERVFRMKLMRNGDDGQDDIVYTLPKTLVRITDEGKEQFSCHVEFVERRKQGSKADEGSTLDSLLYVIYNEKPKTREELAGLVQVTIKTIGRRLAELRKAGLIGEGLTITDAGIEHAKQMDEEEE